MTREKDLKEIISKNIIFLLEIYGLSRKEVCKELNIKYTTMCDWIGARSYPRIETLESLASFFAISIQDFFIEIEEDENLVGRISEYARRFGMKKDYSITYPDGFWSLYGSLSECDILEPEDLPLREDIEDF